MVSGQSNALQMHLRPWRTVAESVLVVVEVERAGELLRREIGSSLQALLQDKLPFTRTYFTDRLHFAQPSTSKDFYRQLFQVLPVSPTTKFIRGKQRLSKVPISPAQVMREKLRAEAAESAERRAQNGDSADSGEEEEPRVPSLPDLLLSNRFDAQRP